MEVVGQYIRNDIIAKVKQANFYSVIADEVTDTANKEELPLSLRFVLDGAVKEVFVDFVEVERITGQVLAQTILVWLSKHGLSLTDIRGQCCDGASNCQERYQDASPLFSKRPTPLALYTHCAAHRLNLAVVSACKLQSFTNAESYMREIARLFHYSLKGASVLGTQCALNPY